MFTSKRVWVVVIVGLLLAGCLSAPENVPEVTNTAESVSIALVTPTATVTVTPTTIVIPIHAATSPATNTPTTTKFPSTSTPTPTTTPAPTLSAIEEGELLSALLTGNAGCELPCWWGVVPGQTSAQAARDLFASQGIDDWTVSFDDTYTITHLGYPRENGHYFPHVTVHFNLENGIVQWMLVSGDYNEDEVRPLFLRDWQAYSPLALLSRYDLPTYIEFVPVENSPYYRLELTYTSLGIIVGYVVPFEPLESEVEKVCFNMEVVEYIGVVLYDPSDAANAPYAVDESVFWEVTTGLDRETFRQMVLNTSTPPCIEVNG